MVNELADWSDQITTKEKTRTTTKGQAGGKKSGAAAKPLPPIRNRVDIRNSLAASEKAN